MMMSEMQVNAISSQAVSVGQLVVLAVAPIGVWSVGRGGEERGGECLHLDSEFVDALTLHYIKSYLECPKSLGPLEHL